MVLVTGRYRIEVHSPKPSIGARRAGETVCIKSLTFKGRIAGTGLPRGR